MKPKATFGDSHTHLGEEVIHVMKGEAGIKLGEREIVLRPGETVTLDPRIEHNVWNAGEGEVKILVAITPPNPRLPIEIESFFLRVTAEQLVLFDRG